MAYIIIIIIIYNDGLPRPDPNNAGPIVRRPMGLSITADCETAWNQTRVYSDSFSTEMQCLRLLRHSGVYGLLVKHLCSAYKGYECSIEPLEIVVCLKCVFLLSKFDVKQQ
jgi:hypothetical protein